MKSNAFKLAWLGLLYAGLTPGWPPDRAWGQTTAANSTSASPPAYQIVDQGPNHRVWQRVTQVAGADGKLYPRVEKYTELASGLNYINSSGQYAPSRELIEPAADGALAQFGQFQVAFGNNLNSEGVISHTLANGKRLVSNVLGLAYYDQASGREVMIAGVQDSLGEIISSNQVLYPNAFAGVSADVRYTYTKSALEQEVILREQPPAPEAYGLDSATTELEVYTEFIDPPAADVTEMDAGEAAANGLEPDHDVSWGAATLGRGHAFDLDGQNSVPVSKHYRTIQGRQVLIEKVSVESIRAALAKLPEQARLNRPPSGGTGPTKMELAGRTLALPKRPLAARPGKPLQYARMTPAKGYVLDYISLSGSYTGYTFQSDSTYYISGNLNLSGTNFFEGATIIKFASGTSITELSAPLTPLLVFKTAPYRPVIFTAKDDNATGEVISGSTGSPSGYYANPALSLANAGYQQFGDFRVAYAVTALSAPGTTLRLTDVQLLNCNAGLVLSGAAVSLNNLLFGNVRTNLVLGTGGTVRLEQATLNNAFVLVSPTNGLPTGTTLALTNCALASVTNAPAGIAAGYNGFYRTALFGAVTTTNFSYPFQTIGAGAYYLTNGCLWHNAGTTNEDVLLLAALANKTTYPPVLANQVHFGTATNLVPQALRDNAGNPDCGYHYDPIDFLLGGCDLYTNLTLAAGTAVAWYETSGGVSASGQPYGLSLNNGSSFTSLGTATAPCWFTRYNTVQEGLLGARGWMGGLMPNGSGSAPLPQISALFTKFSTVPGMGSFLRDNSAAGVGGFTHCELYFGFADYSPSYYFTNCLFFRAGLGISPPGTAAGFTFQNCTFWQGTLQPSRSAGQTQSQWTILNTTFDGTTFAMSDGLGANPSNTHLDYNAFLSGANRLEILGPHDVIVSGAFNWQTSWFGNYYLPTNSTLINAGSTTADQLGLYHFTTQTNQTVEGTSVVDIGYHYVATDAFGNPLDTNGDGIPDYLEDANGDGVFDAGDWGNWQVSPYGNGTIVFGNGLTLYLFEPKPAAVIP